MSKGFQRFCLHFQRRQNLEPLGGRFCCTVRLSSVPLLYLADLEREDVVSRRVEGAEHMNSYSIEIICSWHSRS